MRYSLDEMITVQAYVETLKSVSAVDESLIRVEDYINAIRTEALNANKSSLITVSEYAQELISSEKTLVNEIQNEINDKASKKVQELEKLLA